MRYFIPGLCIILAGFLTTKYAYSSQTRYVTMRSKKNRHTFFYQEETISQRLVPKTPSQVLYKNALENRNISLLFVNGPAGSGKTHMACDVAIDMLNKGNVDKIIVTRPTIPVDNEEIGFLPGTIQRKMAPWLIPVNDVFLNYYTQKEVDRMIVDKIIDFGPIAHMRGRTFTNAYIIADEMQNSTPLQMKMLLTRIGEGSKMIITGDLMQSDLKSETNGLADFIDRYKPWIEKSNDLPNIHLVWLTHMDVFRSETVKAVIKVYEGIENYYKLNKTQEIVEDTNDGTPELTLYHDNTTYMDEQNSSSTSVNGDSALIPISHISRYFKDNDYII